MTTNKSFTQSELVDIFNKKGPSAVLKHVIGDISKCDVCQELAVDCKRLCGGITHHLGADIGQISQVFNMLALRDFVLVCNRCESLAKEKQAVHGKKLELIKKGHLFDHAKRQCERHGNYVYVCQVDENVYKIGATKNNPLSRMSQQGFRESDFVCAIKTPKAFDLEYCLHNYFSEKRTNREKTREYFLLDNSDIEYLKNLKTFNGELLVVLDAATGAE